MTTNKKIKNNFKRIILFSSLNGGTGKSFIAKYIAKTYGIKSKVGLIDSDINSLGLTSHMPISKIKDIIDFGKETERLKRIESKTDSHGNTIVYPLDYPSDYFGKEYKTESKFKFISPGLLDIGSVLLGVRGAKLSSIVRLLINDVSWGELDYLLIDTPSGLSDIELTLLDDFPNSEILFVSNGNMIADKRKIEYYCNRGIKILCLVFNEHTAIDHLVKFTMLEFNLDNAEDKKKYINFCIKEYETFCKDLSIDFIALRENK
ncbi:MAG: P-loop NTPase [Bacteroidetes bacterium]|nr:P-loop NTPase [Bacteroidota bacterium]